MNGAGEAVAVGIDVAEERKGLDLVALRMDRTIAWQEAGLAVTDAVAAVVERLRPVVVCVDSPSGWSRSGPNRAAERLLGRHGLRCYPCGPDPGEHPFYRWMRVGMALFAQLKPYYPTFRGDSVEGRAAEVFPHATASLLTGHLPGRAMSKRAFRASALEGAGVATGTLRTQDAIDAALAALTGVLGLEGVWTAVGDADEGMVLLPVRTLEKLSRPPR